jgi:hypothetical protein
MSKMKTIKHMKIRGSVGDLGLLAVLLVLLALPSCREETSTTPQERPVLEQTSVHYMLPAVTAAHEGIVNAEEMLLKTPPDIDAARNFLRDAGRSLANVEWFYVPATEARDNVYNAYLELLAGHPDRSNIYLDVARHQLTQIAERSSSQVGPYIEDLAKRIDTIQLHARDGAPIHDELKSLCETFQLHLLKAQLVIDEHAFDKQESSMTIESEEVDHVTQN